MTELRNSELSGRVIEAAIAVHTAVGPGFLESVYENALCIELRRRGIELEQQTPVVVGDKGERVGERRLNLLVAGLLLVELKACKAIEAIFLAVARAQMRAIRIQDGIILSFAAMPLLIKRVGPGPISGS